MIREGHESADRSGRNRWHRQLRPNLVLSLWQSHTHSVDQSHFLRCQRPIEHPQVVEHAFEKVVLRIPLRNSCTDRDGEPVIVKCVSGLKG